jgi:hypothetical protein
MIRIQHFKIYANRYFIIYTFHDLGLPRIFSGGFKIRRRRPACIFLTRYWVQDFPHLCFLYEGGQVQMNTAI